jgi:hypothetical protein
MPHNPQPYEIVFRCYSPTGLSTNGTRQASFQQCAPSPTG